MYCGISCATAALLVAAAVLNRQWPSYPSTIGPLRADRTGEMSRQKSAAERLPHRCGRMDVTSGRRHFETKSEAASLPAYWSGAPT
jgi:hypothetical protein